MRFSGLKILTEGLKGNSGWGAHWRDPEPAQEYDIIIIGGGGHGLPQLVDVVGDLDVAGVHVAVPACESQELVKLLYTHTCSTVQ